MASRFIQVEPNVRLWVKDVGRGQPLVFLHGWPASHQMFEYQFNELPKHGVRCIGIDTRGFGRSDHPWEGYNYTRLAHDVIAVLDALDLPTATLVGFSQGGAIALRTVAAFGERIDRLALLAAAAPCVTRRDDFEYGIERAVCDDLIRLAYRDRPKMISTFARQLFHQPNSLSPEFTAWFQRMCEEAAGHATIACCELFRDADLRFDLDEVKCPTLIVHGASDRVCTFDLAEQTHAGISGSTLVQVDAAGHGFFYEQRNRINEELLKFVGVGAGLGLAGQTPSPS